jgi:hypothetical protein
MAAFFIKRKTTMNTTMKTITRKLISNTQRTHHTTKLFGSYFPLTLEPVIFSITSRLSRAYKGGYWHFYELNNGGFYMAPDDDAIFPVVSENGYEGNMAADALGVTACLYAYSHLSFGDEPTRAKMCAQLYHLLRAFMMGHAGAKVILAAID